MCDGESAYALLCERTGRSFPFNTHTVRTCGGGTHRYFTIPTGIDLPASTIGTLGWKVDTRCRGGYVVATGSVVDGSVYRCEVDQPPALVPASLLISNKARPVTGPQSIPGQWAQRMNDADAYTRAALTGETDRVRTAPEGQRNATLFRAAAALGRLVAAGTLPREAAEGALTEAAHVAGLGEIEIRRTLTSGLTRGASTPTRRAA